MEVNLFDVNGLLTSPVPGKDFSPKKIKIVKNKDNYDGITIITDKHIVRGKGKSIKSKIKIAWLWEPQVVHPALYKSIRNVHKDYDYVFSHNENVLNLGKKCICVPTGMTWIPEENRQIFKKSKKVSAIVSKKKSLRGHRLRHELCKAEGVRKFGTSVKYIKDKTDALKDFMFSVAVENCSIKHYFTEKLIDCFVTGTVPIYWGCTNLEKYFNMDGVIKVKCLKHLNNMMPNLNANKYKSMLPAIEDNYNRALKYVNMFDWVYDNILKDLK